MTACAPTIPPVYRRIRTTCCSVYQALRDRLSRHRSSSIGATRKTARWLDKGESIRLPTRAAFKSRHLGVHEVQKIVANGGRRDVGLLEEGRGISRTVSYDTDLDPIGSMDIAYINHEGLHR